MFEEMAVASHEKRSPRAPGAAEKTRHGVMIIKARRHHTRVEVPEIPRGRRTGANPGRETSAGVLLLHGDQLTLETALAGERVAPARAARDLGGNRGFEIDERPGADHPEFGRGLLGGDAEGPAEHHRNDDTGKSKTHPEELLDRNGQDAEPDVTEAPPEAARDAGPRETNAAPSVPAGGRTKR